MNPAQDSTTTEFENESQKLSLSGAAKVLGISHTSLRRHETLGKIQAERLDNGYRLFDIQEVNRFKKQLKAEHEEYRRRLGEEVRKLHAEKQPSRETFEKLGVAAKKKSKYRVKVLAGAFIGVLVFTVVSSLALNNSYTNSGFRQYMTLADNWIQSNLGIKKLASKYDEVSVNVLSAADRNANWVFNINGQALFKELVTMNKNLNVSQLSTLSGGVITNSLTFNGLRTINNLGAIDATTETTLEGALDLAGDVESTGLGSTTVVALNGETLGDTVTDEGNILMAVGGEWVSTPQTDITSLGSIGTGTWEADPIGEGFGGTGLSTYATGDILYATAPSTLATLPIGTNGYLLTSNGTSPSWQVLDPSSFGAVTEVIAGLGLSGGGTGGVVTLNVGTSGGITLNPDDITLDVATTGVTSTTASNSGLEVVADGLKLIGGCSNGEILSWDAGSQVWECTPAGSGTVSGSGSIGQVSYWNGGSSLTGSDSFFWDSGTSRLGLGTTAPSTLLDVNGIASFGQINLNADNFTDLTGNGLTVSGNALTIDATTTSTTATTASNSGLEVTASGLRLVSGCALNEVLAWDSVLELWRCTSIVGVGGVTGSGEAGQVSYWSGANTITGTNSFFWDNSVSKLGIGTSAPASALTIAPSDAAGLQLNPFGASAGQTTDFRLLELTANGSEYTGFKAPDSLDQNIVYTLPVITAPVDYVLTYQNGSVLQWKAVTGIAGSGDITAVGSVTSGDAFSDATATNQWLGLGAAAGNIQFFDRTPDVIAFNNASVGIGTTNPIYKLSVNGTTQIGASLLDANDKNALIDLARSWGQIKQDTVGLSLGTFYSGASQRDITINYIGNVGIGTTAPLFKLDVSGAIRLGASGNGNTLYTSSLGTAPSTDLFWGNRAVVDSSNIGSYATIGVTAGSGLTGGGTVGALTLDIGAGNGITVNANDITIDAATAGATSTTASNSGLEVVADGLRMLGGCASNEVLSWDSSNTVWKCTAVSGTNSLIGTGSANQVAFWSNTTNLTGSDNLYWNSSTSRLGIGTTMPSGKLQLTSLSTSFLPAMYIENPQQSVTTGAATGIMFAAQGGGNLFKGGIAFETKDSYSRGNLYFLSNNTANFGNATLSDAIMTIANTGYVGIGTTGPTRNLVLNNASDSFASVRSGDTNIAGILLGDQSSDFQGQLRYDNANNSLALWTSGTEKVRVDTSGNVGIGTTAPTSQLHLYKNQADTTFSMDSSTAYAFKITNRYSAANQLTFGGISGLGNILDTYQGLLDGLGYSLVLGGTGTGISNSVLFRTHNAYRMVITDAGLVGIGTTAPAIQLQVAGAGADTNIGLNNTGTSGRNYMLGSSSLGSTAGAGNFYVYDAGGGGGVRLVINSTGNVGIGTTNPTSKLSVGASSQFQVNSTGNIVLLNNVITSFPSVQGATNSFLRNDGTGTLNWADPTGTGVAGYWNRTGTTLFPTSSSDNVGTLGKVGVGTTSPLNSLDVSGAVAIGSLPVDALPQSNMLYVSGNVGIGTTAPAKALSVIGSIRASTNVEASNAFYFYNNDLLMWPTTAVDDSGNAYTFADSNGTDYKQIKAGSLRISDTSSSTLLSSLNNDGSAYFSGNVGIGTTLPAYKLDVVGVARAYDVATQELIFANSNANILSAYAGYDAFTNFTGGIGTGGKDSLLATQRITTSGNLVNIGSIQAGETTLTSSGTFAAATTYPSLGSGTVGAVAGDLNGDGKADLALVNSSTNSISVLMNNGSGTFGAATTYPTKGTGSNIIVTSDLNGDGKADLVYANNAAASSSIGVLINTGTGTFGAATTYPSGLSKSVIATDLNGDGKPDLAFANTTTNNSVGVMINSGTGTFGAATTYPSGGASSVSIAAADVNGDGKADLVFANSSTNSVGVMLNAGSGTFGAATTYPGNGQGTDFVAIADFSNDGKADLALINNTNDSIGIMINSGTGTFGAAATYPAYGVNPQYLTTGDLNGDGKPDIAYTTTTTNSIGTMINNGSGTFAVATTYPSKGTFTAEITTADFNGDGKLDLAYANSNTGNSVGVMLNTPSTLFNADATLGNLGIGITASSSKLSIAGGTIIGSAGFIFGQTAPSNGLMVEGRVGIGGTSAPAYQLDVGGVARAYNIATQELIFADSFENILSAYAGYDGFTNFTGGIGTGSKDSLLATQRITAAGNLVNIGSIQAGETLLTSGGTFGTASTYPTLGAGPLGVAVGDLNGDGKIDAVAANSTNNSITVFTNNGSGTFSTTTTYPARAVSPTGVTLGDLNGDGKLDIVTVNNAADASISVLTNTGTGTFGTATTYPTTSTSALSVVIADISQDGKADIIAGGNTSNSVVSFINTGTGTFGAAATYPIAGTGIRAIAVGDVNGDGKADIVTANNTTNSVGVILNNGTGTFGTATTYPSLGTGTFGIALADTSGDGRADIITTNNTTNSIAVLTNSGTGTFTSGVTYPSLSSGPYNVMVGDLNGDGKVDIANTNLSSDSITILTNTGTGTFGTATTYPTQGSSPRGIALADINGDGKKDIVVGNASNNSIAVFTNQSSVMLSALASTGNLGIGSTPSGSKLSVNGNMMIGSTAFMFGQTAPSNGLMVEGRVGIGGTSAPAYQLDVGGVARAYNIATQELIFADSFENILSAYAGYDGFTNFTGGIGTGSKDSLLATQRITAAGNLVNIGSIQAGETTLTSGGTLGIATTYPSFGNAPEAIAMGDLNGDGKNDLAFVHQQATNGNSMGVMLNTGTGTFASATTYPSIGLNPRGVTIGDFNGDGKNDLAFVNNTDNNVGVYINAGSGTFGSATTYPSKGVNPEKLVAGDLNGDGKADLAFTNFTGTSIGVLLNAGTGTFGAATTYPALGTGTQGIAMGDFNGDGRADIAYSNANSNSTGIMLNSGAGIMGSATTYPSGGSTPEGLSAVDINGDGKTDITFANNGTNSIGVQLNAGTGTFGVVTTYPSNGSAPRAVSPADMNGDGKTDIVFTNSSSNSVGVIINSGTGTFGAATTYPALGIGPRGVAAGDVNGDGKADVAYVNVTRNSVGVMLNQISTLFNAAATGNLGIGITASGSKLSIAGGTIIGSSSFIFGQTAPSNGLMVEGRVGIGGTSAPAYQLDVGGVARAYNIATQELIFADSFENILSAYAGYDGFTNFTGGIGTGGKDSLLATQRITSQGNLVNIGSIQAGETLLTSGGTFGAVTTYPSNGSGPYAVAAGDLNGDGKADLAFVNLTSNSVGVRMNSGTGTFGAATTYPANGGRTAYITMGDFNGDGKADLAFTNNTAPSSSIGIMINSGTGTFGEATTYPSNGLSPMTIVTGDFNGDGKSDLAFTNNSQTTNSIGVLINNGTGTFGAATTYPSNGGNPFVIVTGDFNGDGKADLAFTNNTTATNSIGVMMNSGTGTFGAATTYPPNGGKVSFIVTGDLNGDGKADLAAANQTTNSIGVLINNGTGTFGAATTYPTRGLDSYAIEMGDFNGDGDNDLAFTNFTSNSIGVMMNSGTGTFGAATTYPSNGEGTYVISTGEFNGDGKTDLAYVNFSSNSIGVMLNTPSTIFNANAATGNIGIGTTAGAQAKLVVAGNMIIGSNAFIMGRTAPSMGLLIEGNVGIGVSTPTGWPASKLAVAGLTSSTGITLVADGSGNFFKQSSSLRYKDNIVDLSTDFNKILDLRPVSFNYKGTGAFSVGYIAEEMQSLGDFPGLLVYNDDGQVEGIQYQLLTVYLKEILKKQQTDVNDLKDRTGSIEEQQLQLVSMSTDINNLNSSVTDLTGTVTDVSNRVNFIEEMLGVNQSTESTESSQSSGSFSFVSGLSIQLQNLYDRFNDLFASLGITSNDNTLTVSTDLNVIGNTTLNDVVITGDLLAGQIRINSLENSLDISGPACYNNNTQTKNTELCEAQTMYIQKGLAGNVNLFDGNVLIEPDGNLTVTGTIKATKVSADEYEVTDQSQLIGTSVLGAGSTRLTVNSAGVKDNSKIFITPTSFTGEKSLIVTQKTAGSGFEVSIETPYTSDISFDWWIVNVTNSN